MTFRRTVIVYTGVCCIFATARAAEPIPSDPAYYHQGELAGSLKNDAPLPLYDSDPQSLANRLFAAFYTRISEIPSKRGGTAIRRIEGGDVIDFLAWTGNAYWSDVETCRRLSVLLDECVADPSRVRPTDPLRRAILQRDLWAPFDFLVSRNICAPRRQSNSPTPRVHLPQARDGHPHPDSVAARNQIASRHVCARGQVQAIRVRSSIRPRHRLSATASVHRTE